LIQKIKLKTYENRNNFDSRRTDNYYINDKFENPSKISANIRNCGVGGGGFNMGTYSSTSDDKKGTDTYKYPISK